MLGSLMAEDMDEDRLAVYCWLVELNGLSTEPADDEAVQEHLRLLMYEYGSEVQLLREALYSLVGANQVRTAIPTADELRPLIAQLRYPRGYEESGLTEEEEEVRKLEWEIKRVEHEEWAWGYTWPAHKHKRIKGRPIRCDDNCPWQVAKKRYDRLNAQKLAELDTLVAPAKALKPCRCDYGFTEVEPGLLEPCGKCRLLQKEHWWNCGVNGKTSKTCDCREKVAFRR
jgi:hypothetical protein